MSRVEDGLNLEGVTKSYRTAHHTLEVLRGISLQMAPGEGLAITGPSGSGKSTLLHIVGTLEEPSAGEVTLDGIRPHGLDQVELAKFRNRQIGFVFQDHHLLPQYSVLENVILPSLAFGEGGPSSVERAESLLESVGLGERKEHRPAELSGGERQRVAIARALLNSPRLLLCDEPTGNLDQVTAQAVADLLFELHRESQSILIVVTHSLELARRFERRCELREGLCSPL